MKRVILSSSMSGNVGIWWYTPQKVVWGKLIPTTEGEVSGNYIQFSNSKNHLTEWGSIVKDNVTDEEESKAIISKGYTSIPRGRVIFDTRTNTYVITCQESLKDDNEFKSKICEFFQIPKERTSVECIPGHHYTYELTGNPALDNQEYSI